MKFPRLFSKKPKQNIEPYSPIFYIMTPERLQKYSDYHAENGGHNQATIFSLAHQIVMSKEEPQTVVIGIINFGDIQIITEKPLSYEAKENLEFFRPIGTRIIYILAKENCL